jgi:triphosphoribosyl-dephospho-CoA synthase
MDRDTDSVAALDIQRACLWEVTSRKVGNVHRYRDFEDTTYLDFALSAGAIAPYLLPRRGYGLGFTTLWAVEATQYVTPRNTNLGMILALAPPVASERLGSIKGAWRYIRDCGVRETEQLYKAIRIANPGGLGDAPEQDVRAEPTVTLLEAMKLAADRDMVARQYANGFADVFDFGVPAFSDAFARFGNVEAAIIDSQLHWLATYPDSLIARKNGLAVAEDVQKRTAEVLKLGGIATPEGRAGGVALDRHLRSDGNKLNPGTTADLITACLFVALRENKVAPSAPFRWDVPDWL